ncbi:MAG: CvpA family protein [Acidobacteria bacterium]|jgi:membrane protein required for colicin V production|nr:CvpA family protein [Acidobacteriota bacterium]
MSLLDWVIITILIVSTLAAASSGIIVEVFSLGGLLLGLVLACWNYQRLLPWVMSWGMSLAVAKVIAFVVIALGVMILAGLLGRLIRWSIRFVGLGWLDHLAGAAFGLVKGAVLVVVMIVALLAFLPQSSLVRNSRLAPAFLTAAHGVAGVSPAELSGEIRNGITILRREKNQLFTPKAGVS